MVADFHRRGVRVLFPMMMWDQGTRDPGKPWPDAIAELMKEIDADGINGDTQDGVPLAFSLAAEKIGHPLAFEPEGGPSDEAAALERDDLGPVQVSVRSHGGPLSWLETAPHGQYQRPLESATRPTTCNSPSSTAKAGRAGRTSGASGTGSRPRDAEATRRVATIERAVAPFLVSQDWEPFYPMQQLRRLRQPLADGRPHLVDDREPQRIRRVQRQQMSVPRKRDALFRPLSRRGTEARAPRASDCSSFPIEAHGFGAVLAIHGAPDEQAGSPAGAHEDDDGAPLSSYSHEWQACPSKHRRRFPRPRRPPTRPKEWSKFPAANFVFKVQGIEIEGSDDIGVDVQYPWERFAAPLSTSSGCTSIRSTSTSIRSPMRSSRSSSMPRIIIRRTTLNFLRDWKNGNYPQAGATSR